MGKGQYAAQFLATTIRRAPRDFGAPPPPMSIMSFLQGRSGEGEARSWKEGC